MKPHEETWWWDGLEIVKAPATSALDTPGARLLAAAAPEMARALALMRSRMMDSGWTHGEEWDAIEAALLKAGVLP